MVRLAGAEQGGSYPPVVTFSEQRFRKGKKYDISLKNKFIPLFQSSNLEKNDSAPFQSNIYTGFRNFVGGMSRKKLGCVIGSAGKEQGFPIPCFRTMF